MAKLKPCPFCGGANLKIYVHASNGYVICEDCDAYGPSQNHLTPEDGWNQRAPVVEEPDIPCEFPGCPYPAVYEGWFRKRHIVTGGPGGHIVRIAFCESCKRHPYLCANERRNEQGKIVSGSARPAVEPATTTESAQAPGEDESQKG